MVTHNHQTNTLQQEQDLAYHPPDKTFGGYSGANMSVEGVEAKAQTQQAPPPEPPKPKGTLPKGMEQPQAQTNKHLQEQTSYSSSEGKSRKQQLEEYEKEYLQRIENERIEQEKAYHRST